MGVTVLELRVGFQCSRYKVQGFVLEIAWKGTQKPIGRLFYLSTAEQVSRGPIYTYYIYTYPLWHSGRCYR